MKKIFRTAVVGLAILLALLGAGLAAVLSGIGSARSGTITT